MRDNRRLLVKRARERGKYLWVTRNGRCKQKPEYESTPYIIFFHFVTLCEHNNHKIGCILRPLQN